MIWPPTLREDVGSPNWNELREARVGVMLHYDASGTDAGAVAWFKHPDCRVSYHVLVLDDGSYVRIVPDGVRAWHAGRCRPSSGTLSYSDANSAFYGIAAATNDVVGATEAQRLTIAWLARLWFFENDWSLSDTWRITGHNAEAWPRGRKSDPEGGDLKRPILAVEDIRTLLPILATIAI